MSESDMIKIIVLFLVVEIILLGIDFTGLPSAFKKGKTQRARSFTEKTLSYSCPLWSMQWQL